MPSDLLLPDGSRVNLRPKDTIDVTNPMDRQTFARFHEIAHKHNLSVVCRRCDSAVTGQNNDSTKVAAVACQCREWRFVV